jgi:hypothetical protein
MESAATNIQPPLTQNGFTRLDLVQTHAATAIETSIENVRYNLKKGYPRFRDLPEFRKVKGPNKKIAFVGGGPSVKHYVDDIKQFRTVVACGSANDWVMQNGITPTYSIICDPDPVSINYFQHLDTETKYLIASCCDPKIFEHLKEHQIILWHCDSDEQRSELQKIDPTYDAIGGGCTVGLRAISIAIMLGYSNHHYFGYDSCLGEDDAHHAYGFSTKEEELGKIYTVKVGDDKGHDENAKAYRCAGYQLAQAYHFREFYQHFAHYFKPIFYGDGLLPATMRQINKGLKLERTVV